ncbi:hypothetical protein [Erwinia sorbitola]|uniref:Uncharacterized protein n=1 Tax=Erwinia sorbitola TaxID=2681984 RepID=A0A6I6EZ33_9GAMM|nr:hypothetical protein [Erwinia sorbitola]QGU86900.1 hypothetical protein GN242_06610 [Erwinia sorbitola]
MEDLKREQEALRQQMRQIKQANRDMRCYGNKGLADRMDKIAGKIEIPLPLIINKTYQPSEFKHTQ